MIDKEVQFVELLVNAYSAFLEFYSLNPSEFILDMVVLRDISKRYYRDVDRLHKYHGITRIDAHKIAGYTTYWITKLKPISIAKSVAYKAKAELCLYINEVFAILVSTGGLISANELKSVNYSNSFLSSFLYTLKYRTTSGDNLSMMYYLIENSRM